MKILVWESKNDNVNYDASTPEKQNAAFLKMFNTQLEQGDYECCPPEGEQVVLFERAKTGDGRAAASLAALRKGYEYEGWHFDEVIS